MSAREKIGKAVGALSWTIANPRRAAQLAAGLRYADDDSVAAALASCLQESTMFELIRRAGVEDVSFSRGGTLWRTDVGDEIGRSLWTRGGYEDEEIAALSRWMRANDRVQSTVIDCGANIGTTSIPFAQQGYRVVAVEPVPRTFDLLVENVRKNGLDGKVECVNLAVAEIEGSVPMWTGFASGQAEVAGEDGRSGIDRWGPRGERLEVPSRPLSTILSALSIDASDVAVVWADVQGSEGAIVRSAPELWASGVPMWAEVDPGSLEIHGGLSRFVHAISRSFRGFLTREDLLEGAWSIRSLDEFQGWCASIPQGSFSDLLLVPH